MLIRADARSIPLVDQSVQCVITSPPYWGLRDYGNANQIGLESSVGAYVESIVGVFRDVWRVLRDDGIVWLNIGDSYATDGGIARVHRAVIPGQRHAYAARIAREAAGMDFNIRQKNLIGIPWRVAFALQADDWILRSDVIWSKPNPMPESVTDRPTRAHEYVFLFAKSDHYFYDADAIAEPLAASTLKQIGTPYNGTATKDYESARAQNPSAVKSRIVATLNRGRGNKRSVWHVPTESYAGAHFAVFPEKLIEPCVLAGSRFGDVVFDPFVGSGTVGVVCDRLGRRWIGSDLSYQNVARARTAQRGLLFDSLELAEVERCADTN